MELENERYNEHSEKARGRGWCRDGKVGTCAQMLHRGKKVERGQDFLFISDAMNKTILFQT
jgi:hypothetical protein